MAVSIAGTVASRIARSWKAGAFRPRWLQLCFGGIRFKTPSRVATTWQPVQAQRDQGEGVVDRICRMAGGRMPARITLGARTGIHDGRAVSPRADPCSRRASQDGSGSRTGRARSAILVSQQFSGMDVGDIDRLDCRGRVAELGSSLDIRDASRKAVSGAKDQAPWNRSRAGSAAGGWGGKRAVR